MVGQALQFLGSLAAISALVAIAAWLKLGTPDEAERLDTAERIAAAALAAVPGFTAVATAADPTGEAALARDSEGRVVLLRRHGAHYAGRLLTHGAATVLEPDGRLRIVPDDPRFGPVTLKLDNPDTWATAIAALG